LKILAKFYDLQEGKFHCLQLFDLQSLCEFHIDIQFHYLAARYLPETAVVAFIALHLQHRLIT
jgi:hypothetical protein